MRGLAIGIIIGIIMVSILYREEPLNYDIIPNCVETECVNSYER